jgi:hypothetical protein
MISSLTCSTGVAYEEAHVMVLHGVNPYSRLIRKSDMLIPGSVHTTRM